MHTIKSLRWFALTAALGLAASAAHAEMITPDSIPNPPGAVASAGGTPVPSSNLVSTQYTGLGVNFSYAAITSLNGVTVWAPVDPIGIPAHEIPGGPPPSYPTLPISYGSWTGGNFVVPGTLKPTSVYSMTLEIVGSGLGAVDAWTSRGQWLNTVTGDGIGPHGGSLYTISGGGISTFDVFVPVRDPPDTNYPAWGVAAVSFTNNPEPSSLVLAGLGALSLAARLGWRRSRAIV